MIENRVVVITGASSGIGEATAKLLAKEGAKVVLGARREDKLERIADEITNDGGRAVYQELDVTKPADNEAIVRLAKEAFWRPRRHLPERRHHAELSSVRHAD
jgi:NADP-dependent 3-hydroxy acid dehydrogenase YdfG